MAQVIVSREHNLDTIVQLSGAESGEGRYDSIDTLYVDSVTQEALDDALAVYMGDLETYLLEPRRVSRKEKISRSSASFIEERYPSFRRELFIALAEEARNSGLTNRVAYINQMLTWVKTVVAAVLAAEDMVDSYDTVEEIKSTALNTEVFASTDPEITIRGAMAIED
tara:strand:- start:11617 stop:12120 length:504 start_codon:yes stop_codon:yes gene_type:complete